MSDDRIDRPSGNMPDEFDRLLGSLEGLPGLLKSPPTTIQLVDILGASKTFIVKTIRMQDDRVDEDHKPPVYTTFLECYSRAEKIRIVLPQVVTDLIMRQRDGLVTRAKRVVGKRVASERKAAGLLPGFMKDGARQPQRRGRKAKRRRKGAK